MKTILEDVSRRQEKLGPRVAAKDIENCLEDTVSIFEAVLKALLIRYYTNKRLSEDGINEILKKVGNAFQSITRTHLFFQDEFAFNVFDGLNKESLEFLELTFEMRHPITHNLGIVDKKYLKKVGSVEKEGREIRVTIDDIKKAINISFDIFKYAHGRLFQVDDGSSRI